ncbi:hypothetical protein CEXT_717741 [Caerostris extrusa]|uniref:Uncharacterized protein n=1 Tax=Caerostris extrusa TaxID=172846 RepID=A0AAV4RUJ5_CAEEX|nr:hypothetical protein CEXT_717741 [Caerostris extrusa]
MTHDPFCINNLMKTFTNFDDFHKVGGFFPGLDKRFCTRLFVFLLPNSFRGGFKSGQSHLQAEMSPSPHASAMKNRANEFVQRIYSGALSEDSATGSTPAARVEDAVLAAYCFFSCGPGFLSVES